MGTDRHMFPLSGRFIPFVERAETCYRSCCKLSSPLSNKSRSLYRINCTVIKIGKEETTITTVSF